MGFAGDLVSSLGCKHDSEGESALCSALTRFPSPAPSEAEQRCMCLCVARAPSFSLTVGLGLRVLAGKAGEAGGRRAPTPPRLRYIDWMPRAARAARHRSAPTALTRAVGQARMLFEAAHIEPNQTRICVAFTEAGASTGESQKRVHAHARHCKAAHTCWLAHTRAMIQSKS